MVHRNQAIFTHLSCYLYVLFKFFLGKIYQFYYQIDIVTDMSFTLMTISYVSCQCLFPNTSTSPKCLLLDNILLTLCHSSLLELIVLWHIYKNLPYQRTWSMLPVFSEVQVAHLLFFFKVLFWLFHVVFCTCLFSLSCHHPWIIFFWLPIESWFSWFPFHIIFLHKLMLIICSQTFTNFYYI